MNENRTAKITNRRRVYDGFFKMDQIEIEQDGPAGKTTYTREVFERGHSAAVLLYDPATDCIALVEELRAGPMAAGLPREQCWSLGPVAGGIELKDGDDPARAAIQTALREAEEEAGVIISEGDLKGPLSTMVSPGGTSEVIHHFIACVDLSNIIDGSVHGLKDENEEIITHVMSRGQARCMIGNGIQNGLTITLLMLLEAMIENGFRPEKQWNSGKMIDDRILRNV